MLQVLFFTTLTDVSFFLPSEIVKSLATLSFYHSLCFCPILWQAIDLLHIYSFLCNQSSFLGVEVLLQCFILELSGFWFNHNVHHILQINLKNKQNQPTKSKQAKETCWNSTYMRKAFLASCSKGSRAASCLPGEHWGHLWALSFYTLCCKSQCWHTKPQLSYQIENVSNNFPL